LPLCLGQADQLVALRLSMLGVFGDVGLEVVQCGGLETAEFVVRVVGNQVVAFALEDVLDEPDLQVDVICVLFAVIDFQDDACPVEEFDNVSRFWHGYLSPIFGIYSSDP